MSDLKHETTTVWHRGRPRTFRELDKAEEWLKEIKMAKDEKREAKSPEDTRPNHVMPGETGELKRPNVAIKEDQDAQKQAAEEGLPAISVYPIPGECADCGVTFEENNLGGTSVSHPTRYGGPITASVKNAEETAAWLKTTHAQESNPQ